MAFGKVWLVGAGPGDPELITVRGQKLLSQAEVVLHDALSHPALLEHCRAAEILDVGKRFGRQSPDQTFINRLLIEHARRGKRVVRLKGGDPLMFARGSEEALALAEAGVPFEIVPGISSPVAASAYAGISLTHRALSSSVTFITGSDRAGKQWSPEAWKKLATATDTVCVLMGMRRIVEITQALLDGGREASTPAAVIQWGARPEQRVVTGTLQDIAAKSRAAGLSNPAIIVVGPVAGLRQELRWYDALPLFGKRVLVPRPPHQAGGTAVQIRERAAEPVLFPVIDIHPPPDRAPLDAAIARLGDYDWVLFTSANGVERFFEALASAGRDARALAQASIAVIGPKTAEALRARGLTADLMAEEFVGESLAERVIAAGARRVLLARALVARDALPEMLRQAGVDVDVVAVYETRAASAERAAELVQLLEDGGVDVALFTSSSTVTHLLDLLGERGAGRLSNVTVASIGPVTSRTLRAAGVRVDVEAEQYTVAGVLDALERHFSASASAR